MTHNYRLPKRLSNATQRAGRQQRLPRYFELDKNSAVNNPMTSSVISILYDGVTGRRSILDKPFFVRGIYLLSSTCRENRFVFYLYFSDLYGHDR